jgi:hypothetical protein
VLRKRGAARGRASLRKFGSTDWASTNITFIGPLIGDYNIAFVGNFLAPKVRSTT